MIDIITAIVSLDSTAKVSVNGEDYGMTVMPALAV